MVAFVLVRSSYCISDNPFPLFLLHMGEVVWYLGLLIFYSFYSLLRICINLYPGESNHSVLLYSWQSNNAPECGNASWEEINNKYSTESDRKPRQLVQTLVMLYQDSGVF